jgi:hypothetical protein
MEVAGLALGICGLLAPVENAVRGHGRRLGDAVRRVFHIGNGVYRNGAEQPPGAARRRGELSKVKPLWRVRHPPGG